MHENQNKPKQSSDEQLSDQGLSVQRLVRRLLVWLEGTDYKERFERLAKHYALDLTEAHEERDQWKANHDNQVELKRIIAARPDLKDRAPMVEKLMAERNRAQGWSTLQHERIKRLEAVIRELDATHVILTPPNAAVDARRESTNHQQDG